MADSALDTIVYTLQLALISGCIFISGLSTCLSLWIVPLSLRLPPAQMVSQFTLTFTWGGQYLLPSSRLLGGTALLTTILVSRLSDASEAERWKVWAACLILLISLAPYEINFIFTINDRIGEIGEELKSCGKNETRKKELESLLRKWQGRNFVRMGVPLVVGIIGLNNIVTR